jgi:hypothetical protein
MQWMFELVMDYGDHEFDAPGVNPTAAWSVRPDPFSSRRAGFEIRTHRRCQRFLMFHRFPELGLDPKLVRSLTLDYDDYPYPAGAGAQVVPKRSPLVAWTSPAQGFRPSLSVKLCKVVSVPVGVILKTVPQLQS